MTLAESGRPPIGQERLPVPERLALGRVGNTQVAVERVEVSAGSGYALTGNHLVVSLLDPEQTSIEASRLQSKKENGTNPGWSGCCNRDVRDEIVLIPGALFPLAIVVKVDKRRVIIARSGRSPSELSQLPALLRSPGPPRVSKIRDSSWRCFRKRIVAPRNREAGTRRTPVSRR